MGLFTQRNEISRPDDTISLLTLNQHEPGPKDREKTGWVSPRYTISSAVALQPPALLQNRCIAATESSPEVNTYRILRSQIMRKTGGCGGTVIMVTSAVRGEGKTLTAINLSLAFAREFGQTALLVDCDLRRQQVAKMLGLPGGKGLGDYFIHGEPLENVIVWPGIEKLTIISGGIGVQGSSELLGSPGMKRLVGEMKQRYVERVVILDVPAVLDGVDAISLAPLVDSIVVVTRAGQTSGLDVQKALQLLPPEKLIGCVLNRLG